MTLEDKQQNYVPELVMINALLQYTVVIYCITSVKINTLPKSKFLITQVISFVTS